MGLTLGRHLIEAYSITQMANAVFQIFFQKRRLERSYYTYATIFIFLTIDNSAIIVLATWYQIMYSNGARKKSQAWSVMTWYIQL